jgi:hypothetical protein
VEHRDSAGRPAGLVEGAPTYRKKYDKRKSLVNQTTGRDQTEGEEMSVPNQRERQVMQRLRGGDWLKAIELPMGQRLFKTLLDKEWIVQESRGPGRVIFVRLTEKGLAAKITPIPARR